MNLRAPYYVYFMGAVGGGGRIKIGRTNGPMGRLEELARWSPVDLEFLAVVPAIPADEIHLQIMFREHHVRHEWFNPTPELLAVIEHARLTGELPEGARWSKRLSYKDLPTRGPECVRRQGDAVRATRATNAARHAA